MTLPTITLPLFVLAPAVRTAILTGCDNAETDARNAGQEVDTYYQKVRDRLAAPSDPGSYKITIPKSLLTPAIRTAIANRIQAIETAAQAVGTPLDRYHAQAKQRLADL